MAIQNARFILLTEDIEDFFLLGDAGHGLVDDLQCIEGFRSGMELSDAAVNQD